MVITVSGSPLTIVPATSLSAERWIFGLRVLLSVAIVIEYKSCFDNGNATPSC